MRSSNTSGPSAMTPRQAAELERLRAEVLALRARVAELERIPITTVAERRRQHHQENP